MDDDIKPVRVSSEPTLFQQSLSELLKSAEVSWEQTQRWRSRGWLSFELSTDIQYDERHFQELRFIKSLVDSGVGEIVVEYLLSKLEPPFAYCEQSTAFCFGRAAWVQVYEKPSLEDLLDDCAVFGIIDEHWDSWLDSLAESGELEQLRKVGARIQTLLAGNSDGQQ